MKILYVIASVVFLLTTSGFASDGFAFKATGGSGGQSVTVTDASSLQSYASSLSPYIITISGNITVSGFVTLSSNKTIQGANSSSTVSTDFMIGSGVRNVIIKNLNITNPNKVGEGDGITVRGGKCVYITHCTFTDCGDGMCDVVTQADSVTLSWCRFRYVKQTTHCLVNLIGNSDSETGDIGKLHVTFHHCWWDQNCSERMPSVRYGTVHVYNNYYRSDSLKYGCRTRLNAQCLVEGNYYDQAKNPWELAITAGTTTGKLLARYNNVAYLDTNFGVTWLPAWYKDASITQSLIPGTDTVFIPPYPYTLSKAIDVKDSVTKYAGNVDIASGTEELQGHVSDFSLSQNYPNPFNPSTMIRFTLGNRSHVSLTVYNELGVEIASLVNEERPAGAYTESFTNSEFPSGVYFYKLSTDTYAEVRKMLLLK